MTHLVFFLEEPSAREMLKGVLPKILSDNIYTQFVVFEGKQDLEKRLPIRLRAWQQPGTYFVVLRDQDSGDCLAIKTGLEKKCAAAGHPSTLVRIACRELEAFYLGDLAAVAEAIGPNNLEMKQGKAKYRNPDSLSNPSQELRKLAPTYQKVSGSRAISAYMNVNNNRSLSFNTLILGIRNLVNESD
ncbi:MAG: DUF4276 family protein [Candidatus Thiodiazotropha sp.]